MIRNFRSDVRPVDEAPLRPSQCPACASPKVTTTTKVVTADTYWRCEACGEIWNAGRRRAASRYFR